MSDVVATSLLEVLGRTTLWLSVVALLTGIVLRVARPSWPLAHRAAWLLVLLVGWTFLRFPLDLPWFEAEQSALVLIARTLPPTEQAPDESVAVIELHTPVAAPNENIVAATPAAVAEPVVPIDNARPSGQEAQRAIETPAWSTVWKPRAALALLSVWLLGIVVLLAAWLVGYVRFLRLLQSRVAADDHWASEWQAMLAEAGVRRQIPLSMTDDLGPLLCRLPRGFELVVAEPLWRELDAPERLAILRHELAHYRRGDVWSSLAARILALPHWFNPASWWAVNRFDEAAEWACDQAAVGEGETTEYAKVLMRLGQVVARGHAYGSAVRGRSLARRIRRVLRAPATADSTLKKASLVLIGLILAAASVVQLELVAKQQTDNSAGKVAENGASDEKAAPKEEKAASKEAASEPVLEVSSIELNPTERVEARAVENSAEQDRTTARRLVEEARKAYEDHVGAYHAETAPLESVYEWSVRWMEAAQNAVADRAQRIAAAAEHVDRMRELYQAEIKVGVPRNLMMVRFYVTQAEQGLARVQRGEPLGKEEREGVASDRQPVVDYEIQIIDVKIKISQLQDQIDQTKINLEVAQGTANMANQLQKGAIPLRDLARIQGDALKAKVQLKSLEDQLKLHEDKLALLNARAQASAKNSGAGAGKTVELLYVPKTVVLQARPKEEVAAGPAVVTGPTAQPEPTPQPTKRELRYNGNTLAQWHEIAITELSPERQAEAIHAMARFGAKGFGSEATMLIVETIRGYCEREGGTTEEKSKYQMGSRTSAELAWISPKDSLPVLTKALMSDKEDERMIALTFFHHVHQVLSNQSNRSEQITTTVLGDKQVFEEMLKDPKLAAALEIAAKSTDPFNHNMAQTLLNRVRARAAGVLFETSPPK